jgi:hypothetical protein
MRRLTDSQAHKGRAALIDGEYPEGMQARCARCEKVRAIAEGELFEVSPHPEGPLRVFVCSECVGELRRSAA